MQDLSARVSAADSIKTTVAASNENFQVRIQPSQNDASFAFAELWAYRELLYFLVWRDIKVRYKQTVLGAAWAIIQPLFTMVVFSLFFGRLAEVPSDGLPYPIFVFAALVPWTLFSAGLTKASESVVASANLVRKVYFPRLVIPIAAVTSGVVDFAIAFGILLLMMLYFGIAVTTKVLLVPAFVVLALVTALAVGVWLAALNVRFRDVRHTTGFLVQAWLFSTPIAYPSSLLPERWRVLYAVNPMVGVTEGFRWVLLDAPPPGAMTWVSAMTACVLLALGIRYFRRLEQTFADVV